jgi:hypothetical protein
MQLNTPCFNSKRRNRNGSSSQTDPSTTLHCPIQPLPIFPHPRQFLPSGPIRLHPEDWRVVHCCCCWQLHDKILSQTLWKLKRREGISALPKKLLTPRPLGYRYKKRQPRITLVKGHLSSNPGRVAYKRCEGCHKGSRITGTHISFEPELVTVHHSKPALSLWFCAGCPNILIRLDREKV